MTPLELPPKTRQETVLYSIGGLDINTDSELLGTERMAELTNFDLHESDGVATRRAHVFLQYTLDDAVTMITDFEGSIYAGTRAGTLYKDGAVFDTGYGPEITAGHYIDPDNTSVLYLASVGKMQKIRDGILYPWGFDPPVSPLDLVLSADVVFPTAGTYLFKYTRVQKSGDTIIQESNASPSSVIIIKTGEVPGAFVFADNTVGVTHIRIYRSNDLGGTYLFDQEVANFEGTFIRSSKTTAELGAQLSLDNDRPPTSNRFAIFRDRGWLADDINVFYSEKFNVNVWPQLNFIPVGTTRDPIVSIVSTQNGLGVFTKQRRYRILESIEGVTAIGEALPFFGGASSEFVPILSSHSRGAAGLRAVASVEDGVLYVSDDGVYITDLNQNDAEISSSIRGLFNSMSSGNIKSVNRERMDAIAVAEDNSKIYIAYREMDESVNDRMLVFSKRNKKWYSYNIACSSFHASNIFNRLYIGAENGEVSIIDDYSSQAKESLQACLRTHNLTFGAPFVRKMLHYLYVDAELGAVDTLSGTLYVDGESSSTFTVSDALKIRFPNVYGRTFAIDLLYSGENRVKIRGLRFVWTPLDTMI